MCAETVHEQDLEYAKSLVKPNAMNKTLATTKEESRVDENEQELELGEEEGGEDRDEEEDGSDHADNSSWDLLSQPPTSPFIGPVSSSTP